MAKWQSQILMHRIRASQWDIYSQIPKLASITYNYEEAYVFCVLPTSQYDDCPHGSVPGLEYGN